LLSVTEASTSYAHFCQAALEHLEALYGFAVALTRDKTEAEDLVQETYLRAVRAFSKLAPDSNLKSWLFAIMRNAWLNKLRHARNSPQFVELDAEGGSRWPDSMNPYLIFIRKVERERVREAIESLPALYREVILLRDIEGFSYKQIASILNCPVGTVMSRLGRAREKLRLLLYGRQAEAARR
jgi:RNA polymerase sigma-70 factor (ECF subfamily)